MEYSKEDLMEAKRQILGGGENMGTEESKKIWEKNAQFWDNAMGDESNEFHREVVRPKVTELLSPNPADYILDIACGNGNYSSYLAQRGASVVAFDYSKVGNQVSTDTGKIGSCVLHALFIDGDSNIFILNDGICPGCLVEKHFVIFLSVNIKLIAGFGDKNGFLKVKTVKPSVVDSQLCSSSAVKRVEKLGVFKEHCFLILTARYGIVNIRELEAFGILVLAYTENAVIINSGNGNSCTFPYQDGCRSGCSHH